MHLCVVAGTFHPETGGPPTYLYHLLPELIKRGHTLEVITYTNAPHGGYDGGSYPYPIYRVSRQQPIVARLMTLTWQVVRAAQRSDVIFVSEYGLPAALAGKILGKPIVLKSVGDFAWEFSTRHGLLPANMSIDQFQVGRHLLWVRWLQSLRSWYTRAARTVIVPSRYIGRLVSGWGVTNNRIRLIYNAINLNEFATLPNRNTTRTHLDLPHQDPLILCVARLTPWKGIAGVINALPIIHRVVPNTHLIIIGDGQARAYLETLAAEKMGDKMGLVHFLGEQPPERVRKYMRSADVFVLFSTYEGLPHTILEAMATETPVIASDVGGNVEVIEHERTGLLVHPEDVDELAGAVSQLLINPSIGSKLARDALASLSEFSWEILVDDTERVLYEAIT